MTYGPFNYYENIFFIKWLIYFHTNDHFGLEISTPDKSCLDCNAQELMGED